MLNALKCYGCRWLCFTQTGYSDYTVEGDWISCPSGRFEELDKYDDKENEGRISLAGKDCPFYKQGCPAESSVEYTEETDARISEFKEIYK